MEEETLVTVMSKKSSAGRKLDPIRVEMAKKVERARHELAMKMVSERVKIDAEFAADVLKVGGPNLREDIKKDAQETIERAKLQPETPTECCGGGCSCHSENKDIPLDHPPVWERD